MRYILGIDPGERFCGVALVGVDEDAPHDRKVLFRAIIRPEELNTLPSLLPEMPHLVLCGNGLWTFEEIRSRLTKGLFPNAAIATCLEEQTSNDARLLYWRDHKPKGLLRLFPRSMILPPEETDDYAALAIINLFFAAGDFEDLSGDGE